METLQAVTILVGDHDGEPGVVVRVNEEGNIEVLTLEGDIHVYRPTDIEATKE